MESLYYKFRYGRIYEWLRRRLTYTQEEQALETAIRYVGHSRLQGDYMEFGVYRGKTFAKAYHMAKKYNLDMRFFAFDSFQGLPEIKSEDLYNLQFKKGTFKSSKVQFLSTLKKRGVDTSEVKIIKGWFNRTLKQSLKKRLKIEKVALAYIDCDLYDSTVPVLDFLTDIIEDGAIMIFDDWFCFRGRPDKGEQKAFSEWLAKNKNLRATEFHKFSWHGNSFIIHRD